ncbi:MAG: glycosyltransferase family 2 protein [Nitrospina sp.]|nr:glycosyltransferase family 2 protein [Nitrospina sp.]MBT6601067.1 glycosyltransferase family 2 protein [Nitrospina sp.]
MIHSTPNLSVVILAYRSGKTLRQFVDSLISLLDREEPEWELVLVANHFSDDGDKTPEIARQLAKSNIRIKALTKIKKGMMGWDMRSGLEAATGKILAVIDGDGQMPCEDVIRVYRKLINDRLEFAKTYRLNRDDGAYRKIISFIYNTIFKILFPGLISRDINSKPKVMTREVYRQMDLHSDGWFVDAEIMILVRRMKLEIGELGTGFNCLVNRSSFVKISSIFEFLANLVRFRILEYGYWFRRKKNVLKINNHKQKIFKHSRAR